MREAHGRMVPEMFVRTAKDLGTLARERRRQLGIDQADLAKRVGVSRRWVNLFEQGSTGSNLILVLRTLNALGITLIADVASDTANRGKGVLGEIIENARGTNK